MVISIDQIHQSGLELQKFCNLVNDNKDRISKLTLIETGYLKRHYIQIKESLTEEEANKKSKEVGQEWANDNKNFISNLEIPYELVTWQSLVEDEEFKEKHLKTLDDYQNDPVFKKIVDEVAGNYAKKFYKNAKESNIKTTYDDFFDASKKYLIEESTIAHKLVKMGDFQAYPGRSNPAVSYIYKKYFGESDPLPWVRYRIREEEKTSKKSALLIPRNAVERFETSPGKSHSTFSLFKPIEREEPRKPSKFLETVVYTLDTLELTENQEKVFMKKFINLLASIQTIENKDEAKDEKGDQPGVKRTFY